MVSSFHQFGILLAVACITAVVARKLRLPYTVGLVAVGLLVRFLTPQLSVPFTKELILSVLLPPLVFEAGYALHWPKLRAQLPLVLSLATLGVLLSAAVIAPVLIYGAQLDWRAALIFAAALSATDPVSVIATFREAGVSGRLRLIMESESLLNDGTAAAAFAVVLASVSGTSPTLGAVALTTLQVAGGGVLAGALIASIVLIIVGRTEDHLIEVTLATVAAFASFWVAEEFHASGVLATVTAGLMVGNSTHFGKISVRGRESMATFWEFAAFVANSLVFLIIGMNVGQRDYNLVALASVVGILAALAGRAIAVYGTTLLFLRSKLALAAGKKHVLFWGGLRGALSLALLESLPDTFPDRRALLTVGFAVVSFSVVVQGLTIVPFLRLVGELKPHEGKSEPGPS